MTDWQNMTREGFFLADYANLKELFENAKKRIAEYEAEEMRRKNVTDGFTDLKMSVEMVRVECCTSIYYVRCWAREKDVTADRLRELSAMDDDGLLDFATKTSCGNYLGKFIDIKERKYPFSLLFHTYKDDVRYAYDPDYGNTTLVKIRDEKSVDEWVTAGNKDASIELALGLFRESLAEIADEFEKNSGGDSE